MGCDGVGWGEVGWDGVRWGEVEWDGVGWGEVEWDGVRWSGMGCDGVGWGEVEWSGISSALVAPAPRVRALLSIYLLTGRLLRTTGRILDTVTCAPGP